MAEQKGSEFAEKELKAAGDEADVSVKSAEAPSRVYFLADGSLLNTRTDGWKENKLGMAFSEEDVERKGPDENQRITIRKKEFVTSFAAGVEPFTKLIHRLANRVGAFRAREVVVVSDGAPWIENMFSGKFENLTHILDWYHALEHLWSCANKVCGQGTQKAQLWVERYKTMLWNGDVEKLLTDLFAEAMLSEDQTPFRKRSFLPPCPTGNYAIYRRV